MLHSVWKSLQKVSFYNFAKRATFIFFKHLNFRAKVVNIQKNWFECKIISWMDSSYEGLHWCTHRCFQHQKLPFLARKFKLRLFECFSSLVLLLSTIQKLFLRNLELVEILIRLSWVYDAYYLAFDMSIIGGAEAATDFNDWRKREGIFCGILKRKMHCGLRSTSLLLLHLFIGLLHCLR